MKDILHGTRAFQRKAFLRHHASRRLELASMPSPMHIESYSLRKRWQKLASGHGQFSTKGSQPPILVSTEQRLLGESSAHRDMPAREPAETVDPAVSVSHRLDPGV